MSAIIAIWLAVGVVQSGFYYAYFQRHYRSLADRERAVDTSLAAIQIIMGPCSVLSSLLTGATLHGNPGKHYSYGWLIPGRKP